MSLNDDLEKLKTAEEWLLEYPPHSQEFEAALEHVRIIHKTREDLKSRCATLLKNVVVQRCDDERTMKKLRELA